MSITFTHVLRTAREALLMRDLKLFAWVSWFSLLLACGGESTGFPNVDREKRVADFTEREATLVCIWVQREVEERLPSLDAIINCGTESYRVQFTFSCEALNYPKTCRVTAGDVEK